MPVLLNRSLLFRPTIGSVDIEDKNRSYVVKRASFVFPKNGASLIDAAFQRFYSMGEMSPDSQLEKKSPDSQLELCYPSPGGCATSAHSTPLRSTPPHSTPLHSTDMSDNVGGTEKEFASMVPPPFPDMSYIPEERLALGYFLPHSKMMVGNRGSALTARFIWSRLMYGHEPEPGEAVAVWTEMGGKTWIRCVVRDFFTGAYNVYDKVRVGKIV